MKLFIDTTSGITVGLLDSANDWIEYRHEKDKKSSAVIHKLLNELCENNGLDIKEIKQLFQVSGPGSYTGMRVSEGITNIFEWQNFKVNSFYHFEVPKILGIKKGIWIADAFKGETFLFKWDESGESKELIKKDEVDVSSDIPLFVLSDPEREADVQTKDLIYNNSKMLFDEIEKRDLKRELYYYRTIEMEFSKAKTV